MSRTKSRIKAVLLAGMILLITATSRAWTTGTEFNGPHQTPIDGSPLIIQAEDFNSGQAAGYYAASSGNSGSSQYRPDAPEMDVDYDEDIEGGSIFAAMIVRSSGGKNIEKEWVNYTFSVSDGRAGLYAFDYRVKALECCNVVATLVDQRQWGLSGNFEDRWMTVHGPQAVYLTEGVHTLTIAMFNPGVSLNFISIAPVAAPSSHPPSLIDSGDEFNVAEVNVLEYGANPVMGYDNTSPFQDAIDEVSRRGGGMVYAPAGMYDFTGVLRVHPNVTLFGDWANPLEGGSGTGTILIVRSGAGDENSSSFIVLDEVAGVKKLSFWYPGQSDTSLVAYPFTIYGVDKNSIRQITLYNSYKGITLDSGSLATVSDVYATAIKTGVQSGKGAEFPYFFNIHITNRIWFEAPEETITNRPAIEQRAAFDLVTAATLTGFRFGQNEAFKGYNFSVDSSPNGIAIASLPGDGGGGFYGSLAKMHGMQITSTLSGYVNRLDDVPEASCLEYEFAVMPKAAGGLFDVRQCGAKGDGIADDRAAIQASLDQADALGGGTVYLPPGIYRCAAPLSVPSGVELRGASGGPHGYERLDTTLLVPDFGMNAPNPDSAPAFLNLEAASGVRGFSVFYAQQGIGDSLYPILPYPFTIRATGADTWVIDLSLQNTYNGIDFGSAATHRHIAAGIVMTALHHGINVGGAASRGKLERIVLSSGNLVSTTRQNAPYVFERSGCDEGRWNALLGYLRANTTAFTLGFSEFEQTFGLNSHSVNTHMRFAHNGGPEIPYNAALWMNYSDGSSGSGFLFEGGVGIDVLGSGGTVLGPVEGTGGCDRADARWLRTTATLSGPVHIFNHVPYPGTRTSTSIANQAAIRVHSFCTYLDPSYPCYDDKVRISTIAPDHGPSGTAVTITGEGFDDAILPELTSTRVGFSWEGCSEPIMAAPPTVSSCTSLSVTVPTIPSTCLSPGPYTVTVTNAGSTCPNANASVPGGFVLVPSDTVVVTPRFASTSGGSSVDLPTGSAKRIHVYAGAPCTISASTAVCFGPDEGSCAGRSFFPDPGFSADHMTVSALPTHTEGVVDVRISGMSGTACADRLLFGAFEFVQYGYTVDHDAGALVLFRSNQNKVVGMSLARDERHAIDGRQFPKINLGIGTGAASDVAVFTQAAVGSGDRTFLKKALVVEEGKSVRVWHAASESFVRQYPDPGETCPPRLIVSDWAPQRAVLSADGDFAYVLHGDRTTACPGSSESLPITYLHLFSPPREGCPGPFCLTPLGLVPLVSDVGRERKIVALDASEHADFLPTSEPLPASTSSWRRAGNFAAGPGTSWRRKHLFVSQAGATREFIPNDPHCLRSCFPPEPRCPCLPMYAVPFRIGIYDMNPYVATARNAAGIVTAFESNPNYTHARALVSLDSFVGSSPDPAVYGFEAGLDVADDGDNLYFVAPISGRLIKLGASALLDLADQRIEQDPTATVVVIDPNDVPGAVSVDLGAGAFPTDIAVGQVSGDGFRSVYVTKAGVNRIERRRTDNIAAPPLADVLIIPSDGENLARPAGLAVRDQGDWVFTANAGDGSISPLPAGALVRMSGAIPVGSKVERIAIQPAVTSTSSLSLVESDIKLISPAGFTQPAKRIALLGEVAAFRKILEAKQASASASAAQAMNIARRAEAWILDESVSFEISSSLVQAADLYRQEATTEH